MSPRAVVITGHAALRPAEGAPLQPQRWTGKAARLHRMDRFSALAMVSADAALDSAALHLTDDASSLDRDRVAVVLGSAYGCHVTNEDYYRGLLADPKTGASPRLFAYTLPSSPVGEISIHYGLTGRADTLTSGLTSGLDALVEIVRLLDEDLASVGLALAVEQRSALLEVLLGGLRLSDAGAGLVVETLEGAAARGATPLGRVAACARAYRAGRRSAAVADAVRSCLARAELEPGAIGALLAGEPDLDGARGAGVVAPVLPVDVGLLSVGPLHALSEHLRATLEPPSAPRDAMLLVAGDPEGLATAVVVTP